MALEDVPDFRHCSFGGHFGISVIDITPPPGIYARNWGAAEHDVADSVHRPLTLTALTLAANADDEPLVFLDADLSWWRPLEFFHTFRDRLLSELSLEAHQLIFAVSHTHSSPTLAAVDQSLPGSELHATWMETLVDAAVAAVRDARCASFEGILDWHTGHCNLAAVRDLPDPERGGDSDSDIDIDSDSDGGSGSDARRFICGYNPDGEPDDALFLGRITDATGKLRGTIVNYACHPTTLAWQNTAISPDYVGAMRETMREATGAPSMFMLGACGDLAPRYQYVGDPNVADRHGRQVGFAALATLHDMEPAGTSLTWTDTVESGAPLAVWTHKTHEPSRQLRAITSAAELPLKNWPSVKELERQRNECTDRAIQERLTRKTGIRRSVGDGSTFQLPIYAWRIGDAVLVGCCGEPYSVLQRELRRRFDGRTILVINLINGSIGYLPPEHLYDEDVYPVWQTPFDRGSLEITLDTMTRAIQDVLDG
jgi:hypothetical protein